MSADREKIKPTSAPGIQRVVPEGWNTRSGVAKKIGRSVSTIKNWERNGWIVPDDLMAAGGIKPGVHLYSDGYIEKVIRPLLETIHPGPKPKSNTGHVGMSA